MFVSHALFSHSIKASARKTVPVHHVQALSTHCLQLKECEAELETKDVKVKELETLLESKRENESRLTELIQSLRERIGELEGQVGSYETVSTRGEYTISTLQKDLRDSNQRVVQVETHLR